MKQRLVLLVVALLPIVTAAQGLAPKTSFDSTYEACLLARRSLQGKTASKEEMKEASRLYAKTFQMYNIGIIDGTYSTGHVPNKGHIVYLPSFFDSLIVEKNIYKFAKRYQEGCERRGVEQKRQVKVANTAVKGGKTLVLEYQPDGKTVDFALVTEPKRNMTMFIEAFDQNGQKIGERIQRKDAAYMGYPDCVLRGVEVPQGTSRFKITVQNKSRKDSSFILIISD